MHEGLEIITTCPLGHKCREIKDDKIHQCQWYMKLVGKDPQSNKEVDEHGCAMTWLPILLIENSQQTRHTGAAIESFRNEMVKGNNLLLETVAPKVKAIR